MAEVTLEAAPRKAREQFEKGLAAFERGNLDYAMDMFELALEISPRLLHARKFLRAAAIKKSKAGKGGAMVHAVSTLSGLGGILQAQSQIKKKPEQAVKGAEALLRKDPFNMTFLNLFAQAAVGADMPEAAVLTLEIAREHYPKDLKTLELLAKLYMTVDRMHDARVAYEELARQKPNDAGFIKALKDVTALDTMQRGRWEEATSYRDVIKDTKEATLLEQQAKAVKTDRDVDALIEETLGKIQREPQNINYKRALADLYVRAERLDEALAVLRDAEAVTGGADPQIERAVSTVRVQMYDRAARDLEAAGDSAGAEAKRAEKKAFLLQDAEDRVRRYPNDLQFRYELGVLYFDDGRHTEAIQQFQQAGKNPQRRIRSLYYLALCFKQKGQFDIASQQLEKALSELHLMDDTKKDILYELGTVYEAMGDTEKAAAHLKEIYAVDIGYRDVAEKIEKHYKK
jgi:tetratricopeptide (TPR) repeat protein